MTHLESVYGSKSYNKFNEKHKTEEAIKLLTDTLDAYKSEDRNDDLELHTFSRGGEQCISCFYLSIYNHYSKYTAGDGWHKIRIVVYKNKWACPGREPLLCVEDNWSYATCYVDIEQCYQEEKHKQTIYGSVNRLCSLLKELGSIKALRQFPSTPLRAFLKDGRDHLLQDQLKRMMIKNLQHKVSY